MLGGGGSIQGMITSLRNNKNLLRKGNRFNRDDFFLRTNKNDLTANLGKIKDKEASPEVLKAIRLKAKKSSKQHKAISVLLSVAFMILAAWSFYSFYKAWNAPPPGISQEEILAKKQKDYYYYIEDGDKWFGQRKWHNAAFQYRKAMLLFPQDYDANYRLALAYKASCKFDFEDCDKAEKVLQKLERASSKSEILTLRKELDSLMGK